MAPAPTEESVTNTPSSSPAKVVSVAVHRGSGSACRVAVSRRSHRCDRTQTAVMTRAMPKAVVIRGGEALPLMPKIWSAKSVRIVAVMLPAGDAPVHRSFESMRQRAAVLGYRRVEEVGPDSSRRVHPKQQNENRRHQRAAAY